MEPSGYFVTLIRQVGHWYTVLIPSSVQHGIVQSIWNPSRSVNGHLFMWAHKPGPLYRFVTEGPPSDHWGDLSRYAIRL